MKFIKAILLTITLSLSFLITPTIKADIIPGTNYEIISELTLRDTSTNAVYQFSNQTAKNIFLEQMIGISTRSYTPHARRQSVIRRYSYVWQSGHITGTVYGGPYGGTINVGPTFGFTTERGFSLNVNQGASYNVPPHQYGNVVIKANISATQYKIEQRAPGGKWQSAGTATVAYPTSAWYAPVYWR